MNLLQTIINLGIAAVLLSGLQQLWQNRNLVPAR